MTTEETTKPNRALPWLWLSKPRQRVVAVVISGLLFLVLAGSITTLARQALEQMRQLNTASSDNLQWTLSQTEVEFLQLSNALILAQNDPSADLTPLRRWFDVFYSRMNIISNGPIYSSLAEDPQMLAKFISIDEFLYFSIPLIDSSDEVLRAALPEISAKAQGLHSLVRNISLEGIRVFSSTSDVRRFSVGETMERIALLTLGLILLLLLALFFLTRIYRITRRQALENMATRERLQAMLNTSLDAVLVVDRDGRFVEFNGAATEIFGYSEAEALGADMTKLIFADHMIAAHNEGMRRHLETGEQKVIGAGRVQMQAKRKSGQEFPVELSVAKTMSPEGEIFVSYLRDISERIQAEERLTKARDDALAGERAKARFMAVMSHEMRTPLNGLLGSLDLMKRTHLTQKQSEFAEVMQKSGELLLHHVNDVLDIARLESGRMVGDHVALDLDALIHDVLESQLALAHNKGLDLIYRPEAGKIGSVKSSAIGLRQVLLNLVSNAIKFTSTGLVEVQASIIDLSAGEGGEKRLSLRVRDTGIGIAQADQARVFDDFVTLDSSFGRRADGTGLGLGIARRIVQSMGGEIGLISEPKLGSTFWVDLPFVPAANPQRGGDTKTAPRSGAVKVQKTKKKAPHMLAGLDILVVEDNQINRFILREMLVAEGHSVSEAVNGLEGVAMAQVHRYDLVFMDISMPVLDGIAATVRLRAGTGPCANAPIVALTAHALPDDRALFLASGMNAVLNKPLDRAMLLHVLSELTTTPQPAAAHAVANANAMAAPPAKPKRTPTKPKAKAVKSPLESPSPNLPLLRQSTLDDLKIALGADKLGKLIQRYLQEGDAAVAQSAGLLAAGNGPEAQAMLHSFAGASATFGALALQAHLAQMETDLKAGQVASAAQAHPELAALWAKSRALIAGQFSGLAA